MGHRELPGLSYDHHISQLFLLLSLIVFVTLALSALFYGEPFLFWRHAFSDLGNTVTPGGHANAASRLVFSVGMIVGGAVMLVISRRYAGSQGFRHRMIKRWLAILGALGFLVAIYPNDLNHVVHSVGVGTVVGVVYLFTMLFHLELRPRISARLFYIDMIVIQMAVFPYAAAFFAEWAAKQSLQKTCILGLFVTLERIVTAVEESFHPSEVLSLFRRSWP